jgi:hypothetical protein
VGSMSKSPRAAKEARVSVSSRATSRPDRIVCLEMVQALSREHYEELARRFMEAFARALPEVPRAELYWRFKLVVGVLTYILADTDPTGGYAQDLSDVDGTVRRLVTFLAAGLRAPVPASPRQQGRAKEGEST